MGWDTDDSSGLLSHFIGTIDESVWTTDSSRQDPNKPFLQWVVTVDDVQQENFEGTVPETITVNLSIGNGWVEDEDGATIEHKDGLENFKASSVYGRIIGLVAGKSSDYGSNAIIKDGDPAPKVDLSGLRKYMEANGYDDPRVAAIWKGLTFEFRGIGFKYRGQNDDEVYANTLPVRLVGEGEAATSTPKTAPKAAAAVRDTVGIWSAAGADDETATTLNDLANKAKNHSQFAKEALLLPAVKDGSEDLKAAVMDDSVFS